MQQRKLDAAIKRLTLAARARQKMGAALTNAGAGRAAKVRCQHLVAVERTFIEPAWVAVSYAKSMPVTRDDLAGSADPSIKMAS